MATVPPFNVFWTFRGTYCLSCWAGFFHRQSFDTIAMFFFVDDTMYKPMIHDFSTVYI